MMSNQRSKVLYLYTATSPFVDKDIAILKGYYEVKLFQFFARGGLGVWIIVLRQIYFLCKYIWFARLVVVMFGGYHSLLPVLFCKVLGKRSLIIVGGVDCVGFPTLQYGNFSSTILGRITCLSYSLASHISPVHESLIEARYTYDQTDYKFQGLKFFCPQISTPCTTIYNGYDSSFWIYDHRKVKRADSFVTVASWLDLPGRAELKGIDLVLEVAEFFSEAQFTIIGYRDDVTIKSKHDNVVLLQFSNQSKLREIYQASEFYIQVSMSEGFPNAVCEAMLCGCIPIGSAVGGLPDIIGSAGFILTKRNVQELRILIERALVADKVTLSENARWRIERHYGLKRREGELLQLTEKILNLA